LSLLAAAFTGCGSGNKEGASGISGSALFGGVATVGDSTCRQCHSSVREALTQEFIVDQYQLSSPHNVTGLGCESCHGGGAGHNGVGPIPFALVGFTPAQKAARCVTCHDGVQTLTVNGVPTIAPASNATDFATSNHATMSLFTNGLCIRCHTNEGAVTSNISGFTGGGAVIDNPAFGPPVVTTAFTGITCETCHQHGGGLRTVQTRDTVTGNVVRWDPNANGRVDQFDLCTSCHTLNDNNGTLLVDGSTLTGGIVTASIVNRHFDEWYRILASTHFDNPNTGLGANSALIGTNVVEGYNLRKTGENPCYDCHAHEAKTNTRNAGTNPAVTTIHTDWAQSGHGGGLLAQKYAATTGLSGAAQVAAAMNAGAVPATGDGWVHYNWDQTTGTGNRSSCQACHTSTGISNYLVQQTTDLTGYDVTGVINNNNFSHLSGWTSATGSPQNELLYCWGCHSNAGTGALRNTSQAILTFTDPDEIPIVITGAGNSTACIVCHGGRGSAGAEIESRSTRFNGHHAPTAGFLYSGQTHIGYEYPGQSYANPAFFAHDKIGLNAAGPCASCHMGPAASDGKPSHSFAAVTESGGAITAITNQALCNTCHTPGGSFEITPTVMEEEKNGYAQASTILNNFVSSIAGYTNYLNGGAGLPITSTNYNDPVAVPDDAYRAYQNAKINADEPCAYVHNRFYVKRLLFDSIDLMMDGTVTGTLTLPPQALIDFPEAVLWLGADPITGVATRP